MFSTIEEISIIINRYDPINLIDEGAPFDEYIPEAHLIYVMWRDSLTFEVFHYKLYNIFLDQFGKTLDRKKDFFLSMAKDLWSCLKRNECVN